jgi:hypothetical protein
MASAVVLARGSEHIDDVTALQDFHRVFDAAGDDVPASG